MTETRTDPPYVADELTMLRAYLDHHRATLRRKTAGLDRAQLAVPHPPSALTLAGLLKHLALQEDWWLGMVFAGHEPTPPFAGVDFDTDPDWEFRTALDDAPEELVALWERTVAAADAVIAAAPDGVHTAAAKRSGGSAISLRWILLHMIEEYARHNGHADLLRENIDGTTGE